MRSLCVAVEDIHSPGGIVHIFPLYLRHQTPEVARRALYNFFPFDGKLMGSAMDFFSVCFAGDGELGDSSAHEVV